LAFLLILTVFTSSQAFAYEYNLNKVTVRIHPNEELLSVVYYLAFGWDEFVINRGDYLREVDSYFGKLKDHEAVTMMRDYFKDAKTIPERDFKLFTLDAYLLQFSEPPEMVRIYDDWKDESLDKMVDVLRDFAIESNFMKFFKAHESYYEEDLEIYKRALELRNPEEFLESYFNIDEIRFEFNFPYLVCIHGHSFRVDKNNTKILGSGGLIPLVRRTPPRTLWSLKIAKDTMFGLPLNPVYVENEEFNKLWFLDFIYHELGHDFTIDKLDEYYFRLQEMKYFESIIEEDMPYLATYDIHFWGYWGMIYEGFADGFSYFALRDINPAFAEWNKEMQKAWGEFWQDDMVELYEKYADMSFKENRTLDEYVPQMMKELITRIPEDKAEEYYQEKVPITPIRALDKVVKEGEVLIIYGTQNSDEKGVEYDKATAELVKDYLTQFYSQWPGEIKIEVKMDINVTDEELKKNLILVGGPVSNKIVQKIQDEFPFKFTYLNGTWVLERNQGFNTTVKAFLFTNSSIEEIDFSKYRIYSSPKTSILVTIRNPFMEDNYIIWIAGVNRYSTRIYRNPTYYFTSYEVYDGEKIEDGFYS